MKRPLGLHCRMDFLDLGSAGLETLVIFYEEKFDLNFIDSQENLYNTRILTSNFKDNSIVEMVEDKSNKE